MTTACSLNEIQSYGLRAARAAGMAWGLAEEAGRAARWLAVRGLPGAQVLAALLQRNDGRAYSDIAPRQGVVWQARGGVLCPICTGSAIADRLATLSQAPLRLGATCCPLLLLPFLDAQGRHGQRLAVTWDNAEMMIGPAGLGVRSERAGALETAETSQVWITPESDGGAWRQLPPAAGSTAVPDRTWRLLQAFAHRTYVPASDQSRAKGAGAGDSDND